MGENETRPPLNNPPIVEAVLDIDCDLPVNLTIDELAEQSRALYGREYPKFQIRHRVEFEIDATGDEPASSRRGVQGYMLLSEDEKQLIQIRAEGFSFNCLRPYSSLDEYLPEIERTWNLFVSAVRPVQVDCLRLRYINKIMLPAVNTNVELNDYFKIGPKLPDEVGLALTGFLNRYTAVDLTTGAVVNTTLFSRSEGENCIPIIFDIAVEHSEPVIPGDWSAIKAKIESLRLLKNKVFYDSLTDKCLTLFQK